jgi:hypothetical protein
MKIRSMGAEVVHPNGTTDGRTDGRTEMTKLTVAFAILQTRLKKKRLRNPENCSPSANLTAVPYRWSGGAGT